MTVVRKDRCKQRAKAKRKKGCRHGCGGICLSVTFAGAFVGLQLHEVRASTGEGLVEVDETKMGTRAGGTWVWS